MENSIKEYTFEAHYEMFFKVYGTGYVANLLRNATNEIDDKTDTLVKETTTKCVIITKKLTNWQYAGFAGQVVLLVCSIFFELFSKRFNKVGFLGKVKFLTLPIFSEFQAISTALQSQLIN